jgi:hypothetical protein
VTAIEEQAAATAGKSTRDDTRLSVGDATRATLPQLRYADAVLAALDAMTLSPDRLETGMRRESGGTRRELFLRLEWWPKHEELAPDDVREAGLTVEWSHLAGWSARVGDDLVALDVDDLADPDVIAEAALHAALCGLRCACVKSPGPDARWEHAVYLDIALTAYDERTGGVSA